MLWISLDVSFAHDDLDHSHFSSSALLLCKAWPRALAPSAPILFSYRLRHAQKHHDFQLAILFNSIVHLPERYQCAVDLQGLSESFGSCIANAVAIQAVTIIENNNIVVNMQLHLCMCLHSTSLSHQRCQCAVFLQGLRNCIGPFSADVAASQAVRQKDDIYKLLVSYITHFFMLTLVMSMCGWSARLAQALWLLSRQYRCGSSCERRIVISLQSFF